MLSRIENSDTLGGHMRAREACFGGRIARLDWGSNPEW